MMYYEQRFIDNPLVTYVMTNSDGSSFDCGSFYVTENTIASLTMNSLMTTCLNELNSRYDEICNIPSSHQMILISSRKGNACINAMIMTYPAGKHGGEENANEGDPENALFSTKVLVKREKRIYFFGLPFLSVFSFSSFFESATSASFSFSFLSSLLMHQLLFSPFFHSLGFFFFFLHFLGFCTILLRFHPSLATFHDHLSPRYALLPPQQFGHMIEC